MNKLKNFVILLLAVLIFHSFSSKIYEKFSSEEITEASKKIEIPIPAESNDSKQIQQAKPLNEPILPFLDYKESPVSDTNIDNQDTEIDVNINDVLADSFDEDFIKSTELNLDIEDDKNKIKYQKPENQKKVMDVIDKSGGMKKLVENSEEKQETCGPGLISRKIEGKLFCESNAVDNWKINKPVSKVLDKITKCTPENAPKAVKDIYNKIVNPPKRHLDNVEIQGSYTMNNNNNKWLNLKIESKKPTKLTETLFANDPDFDSFSRF